VIVLERTVIRQELRVQRIAILRRSCVEVVSERGERQLGHRIERCPNGVDEGNEALGNGLLVNEGKKGYGGQCGGQELMVYRPLETFWWAK
jgi:hypothetical protein